MKLLNNQASFLKRFLNQLALFAIVASVLASCKSGSAVMVKAPDKSAAKAVERIKERSVFNVPINVELAEIEQKMNAAMGTNLYEDNSLDDNGGDNLMAKVSLRQPVKITPQGNSYNFALPLHIWVKAGWKIEQFGISLSKYEDTEFDIDLNFLSAISVDQNYKVITKTTPNGYKWVSKPVLNLGGFKLPMNSVIDLVMNRMLGKVASEVDVQTGKAIDLKAMVSQAWLQIQEPLKINDEYNMWLKVSPEELSLAPLVNNGRTIRTSIGMKAVTETFVGEKPAAAINKNLPNLKIVNNIENTFQVGLLANISFEEASNQAKKILMNQEFDFGKRKIKIVDLNIYPKDDKVVIMSSLTGAINGKVYLLGKPAYDKATKQIFMTDVDFDLESKNALLKTANWLAHNKFVEMLTPYMRYSLDQQMKDAQASGAKMLNNYKVNSFTTLNGKLDKIDAENIYVTEKGFQAVLSAEGKLEVLFKGF